MGPQKPPSPILEEVLEFTIPNGFQASAEMPPVTAISLPEKAFIYCGITLHTENAFLVFMQSLLILMLPGMKLPLDVRHLLAAGDSLHYRIFKATLCDTHVFTCDIK